MLDAVNDIASPVLLFSAPGVWVIIWKTLLASDWFGIARQETNPFRPASSVTVWFPVHVIPWPRPENLVLRP